MKLNINLNAPFPQINKLRDKFLFSLFLGIFIFLFLLIFQPFGIESLEINKFVYTLGYSLITFAVLFLSNTLLPIFFKKTFDSENWTVKKIILLSIFQILVIAFFNWVYYMKIETAFHRATEKSLADFLLYTLAISVFPLIYFIIGAEHYMSKKNQSEAKKFETNVLKNNTLLSKQTDEYITLGQENNRIDINVHNLLYIRSEGNYSEVHLRENDTHTKKLLRCTLSFILHQLENKCQSIKQCHRSYIVNFAHIVKVTGNARNYNIHFQNIDPSIPVSRSFSRDIISQINTLPQR